MLLINILLTIFRPIHIVGRKVFLKKAYNCTCSATSIVVGPFKIKWAGPKAGPFRGRQATEVNFARAYVASGVRVHVVCVQSLGVRRGASFYDLEGVGFWV